MGCCCSRRRANLDPASVREGVVPLETTKDRRMFPEDTESTQRSDSKVPKMPASEPTEQPGTDTAEARAGQPPSSSGKEERPRRRAAPEPAAPRPSKSRSRRAGSKKGASSVCNTDREYRLWFKEIKKSFPENTEPTQPESERAAKRTSHRAQPSDDEDEGDTARQA